MNGVTCKCGICSGEFRITKESAQKGVPGYNNMIIWENKSLPTVQVHINVSPSADICPGCANEFLKDSVKMVDYCKCDFVLK